MFDSIQPGLPLQAGSKVVMTILVHRQRGRGFDVRILHRHDGELRMCPGVAVYKDLSLAELRQVVDEELAPANGPFFQWGDVCSPHEPPRAV